MFLRDSEATIPAAVFWHFQLSGFCFPGIPDANQGLATNIDSWDPSLSQASWSRLSELKSYRFERCFRWFLSGNCKKHPMANQDPEVKGLKLGHYIEQSSPQIYSQFRHLVNTPGAQLLVVSNLEGRCTRIASVAWNPSIPEWFSRLYVLMATWILMCTSLSGHLTG